MKTLTKSEAIFHHRKMYHWIADETRKKKRKVTENEYFDQYNISRGGRPLCDSYACHYDMLFGDDCTHCPINWGGGVGCVDNGSPYCEWIDCDKNDWERAAKLADKIAELPEKTFIGKEEKSPEKITEKENNNMLMRSEILREAEKIVCGEREQQYGSPSDCFDKIAILWNGYLEAKGNSTLTSTDVALMMTLFKIARSLSGQYKRDNYVDMAGYIGCAAEIDFLARGNAEKTKGEE